MSKKPSNIEQLKNFAFEIPKEGLIVRKKGKMNAIYNSVTIERVLSMDKCYCIQNGYVTFITNSQEYLIPYFVGIAEILRKEGFTEIFLVHAFEKGDYPFDSDKAKRWKEVCSAVNQINLNDKRLYIAELVAKRHVGCIPKKMETRSIKIDQEFLIKTVGGNIKKIRPLVDIKNLTRRDYSLIGTFNVLNGIGTIVSNNAETIICKTLPDFELLMQCAGYSLNPALPVLMADGETFLDIHVQKLFSYVLNLS